MMRHPLALLSDTHTSASLQQAAIPSETSTLSPVRSVVPLAALLVFENVVGAP